MATVDGTIIGFIMQELVLAVLMKVGEDDYKTYDIPIELMAKKLDCSENNIDGEVERRLPMKCSVIVQETTVEEIISVIKEELDS